MKNECVFGKNRVESTVKGLLRRGRFSPSGREEPSARRRTSSVPPHQESGWAAPLFPCKVTDFQCNKQEFKPEESTHAAFSSAFQKAARCQDCHCQDCQNTPAQHTHTNLIYNIIYIIIYILYYILEIYLHTLYFLPFVRPLPRHVQTRGGVF